MEIRIPHDRIMDPKTITQVNEAEFKKNGLDMHRNEVTEIVDDFDRGVRILQVEKKMVFTVPQLPWKR